MREQEINRIIHEARGKCWHNALNTMLTCSKCQEFQPKDNPSYTSNWSDYGPMLEWAMKEEWWREFLGGFYSLPEEYLHPLRGSAAIAEFLKERKDAK